MHFKPDPTFLVQQIIIMKHYVRRLRESAFLLKGMKIELIDERNDLKKMYFIMKQELKLSLHI